MIEGFDKEIDALLRQTAKGETASANLNFQSAIRNPQSEIHLDADEIAAFAENALPEKTKSNYTAHFADCVRCRTILANIIALNSEAETVPSSSIVALQTPETTAIPWYRKLFAAPNLAYTMGALVVLFGGFIAFTVIRNFDKATNSADVSQISETQQKASEPNAEAMQEVSAPSAMSNAASLSNSASMNTTSNTMMSNTASVSAGNTASVSGNSVTRAANTNVMQPPRAAAPPPAMPEIAQAAPTATFSNDAADGTSAARISENEKKTENKQTDAEKIETEKPAPRSDSAALSARNTTGGAENDSNLPKTKALRKQSSEQESRQIGGKSFTRKQGVWYDAGYNKQPTTNVSRGSDAYQKLDYGLRSIGESLSGTIVIVWKNKAYRIQ